MSGPSCSKVDGTMHRINHYPLDKSIGFGSTYPMPRELST